MIGSNIANLGLILATCALIRATRVDRLEATVMLLSYVAFLSALALR